MILSSYSNPPYRNPTPRTTTASSSSSPPPPHNHSPKRKRNDSTESLQINTQLQVEQTPDVSGSNSPRTKVADKFQQLQLRPSSRGASYAGRGGRKRARLSPLPMDFSRSDEGGIADGERFDPLDRTAAADLFTKDVDEVGETPDCRTREPRPQPDQTETPSDDSLVAVVIPRQESTPTKPRLRSPPPPSQPSHNPSNTLASPMTTPATPIDRTLSPLPTTATLTPSQAALTWQDSEITGHELDPSGDDDGEGINGIGFRPTTAMAWARQRRRREQVAEWKAREAREARLRRVERRRGERVGMDAEGRRRVVRFAEG